ncbi:MAG TPA: DUF427 domain-containing protein [Stellaceae bacterium]|nr:DUF427 domain-containing protein [Stellaceae bacterium]
MIYTALFEATRRRVRVVINGKTVADSLAPALLLEAGARPVYYFPRADVRTDWLEPSQQRSQSQTRGEATFWTLAVDGRRIENALWSHETPPPALAAMTGYFAFAADKVDHWFEEDEEVFGHARDPYHRVDVRASTRRVRVRVAGEVIADTQHAMFLFETGMPTRYYIPPADMRVEVLVPSRRRTVCPYKGFASYWSVKVGDRFVEDAVWGYLDPLPDCPKIKGLYCFYPERVDAIEVEGGG